MSEARRQHPVTILLYFLRQMKHMAIPFLVFVISVVADGGSLPPWYLMVLVFLGMVVVNGGIAFWRWFFFHYAFRDGALDIKRGAVLRRQRHIKSERVQTVNAKAGVLLRLLGLVSLSIETAGGTEEPEVTIHALTHDEANVLEEGLRGETEAVSTEEKGNAIEITFPRLMLAALTSGGVGAFVLLIFAVFAQVVFFIPDGLLQEVGENIVAAGVMAFVLLGFVLFLISWFLSVVRYVFRYAFFRVERVNGEIHIEHGLLVKRRFTVKTHRIQALSVVEGLLRQPFGFATIELEVAGGGKYEDSFKVVLFPVLAKSEIQSFLDKTLSEYALNFTLTPLPKRALRRYMVRIHLLYLPLIPLFVFFPLTMLLLLLVPMTTLLAYMRYKDGGVAVEDAHLVSRSRYIARTTALMHKNRVQALAIQRNILQRWRKLSTLQSTVLSAPSKTTFQVKDIEETQGERVYKWYSRHA